MTVRMNLRKNPATDVDMITMTMAVMETLIVLGTGEE